MPPYDHSQAFSRFAEPLMVAALLIVSAGEARAQSDISDPHPTCTVSASMTSSPTDPAFAGFGWNVSAQCGTSDARVNIQYMYVGVAAKRAQDGMSFGPFSMSAFQNFGNQAVFGGNVTQSGCFPPGNYSWQAAVNIEYAAPAFPGPSGDVVYRLFGLSVTGNSGSFVANGPGATSLNATLIDPPVTAGNVNIKYAFGSGAFRPSMWIDVVGGASLNVVQLAGENIVRLAPGRHVIYATACSWNNVVATVAIDVPLTDGDGDDPQVLVGTSPQRTPSSADTRVVVDTGIGLDTRCTFRGGGPLRISAPVRRVVGAVDVSGTLLNAAALTAGGFLSKTAKIRVSAFDVDGKEVDRVYFNGKYLGNLSGADRQWSTSVFTVPIELVKFGREANGTNVEGLNELTIEIDQLVNAQPKWCTAVDWVQLDFSAIAPIFLVHGTNAGPSTWNDVAPTLDRLGIPYSRDIQLQKNGSIETNGRLLADRLRELSKAFGARACHLVAHSKGGNDAREFLTEHYNPNQTDAMKALSLYTLSTPFRGTVIADVIDTKRTTHTNDSSDAAIKTLIAWDLWIARFLLPHGDALVANRTDKMSQYNSRHPFTAAPLGLTFYNFSADADLDDDGMISDPENTMFPTTKLADASYRILSTVETINIAFVQRVLPIRSGTTRITVPMIEPVPTTAFRENDCVVTVDSANHNAAVPLGTLNANHGTIKSDATIQGVLSRIRADYQVKEPK